MPIHPGYPLGSRWSEKIRFVLMHEPAPITKSRLVNILSFYEPVLKSHKIKARIDNAFGKLIEKGLMDMDVGPEGEPRYRLAASLREEGKVVVRNGFPFGSRWPEKIRFVLRQEPNPITRDKLVRTLAVYEPQTPLATINKAVHNTFSRFLKNDDVIRAKGGGVHRFRVTKALHGYPHDGRWPEKIRFVLGKQQQPVTRKELAGLLSNYEPHVPSTAIEKAIFNTLPRFVNKGLVGMETGDTPKFRSKGADMHDSPSAIRAGAGSTRHPDYPHGRKWPEKILSVATEQSEPFTKDGLVNKLAEREPQVPLEKIRKNVTFYLRRFIGKGIIGVEGYAVPKYQMVNRGTHSARPKLYNDYPHDRKWPEKILFILERQPEPITKKQLTKALSMHEPLVPSATIKKAILNSFPRMVAKRLISVEPGEVPRFGAVNPPWHPREHHRIPVTGQKEVTARQVPKPRKRKGPGLR